MREDLQYDICPGCAERSPVGMGIIAYATHSCPLNSFIYRTGGFTLRHVRILMGGRHYMQSFWDLLSFPYLNKMPDFDTATDSEKTIYGFIRDAEIKAMKRLRAYIELEEEFNSKY